MLVVTRSNVCSFFVKSNDIVPFSCPRFFQLSVQNSSRCGFGCFDYLRLYFSGRVQVIISETIETTTTPKQIEARIEGSHTVICMMCCEFQVYPR